MTTEELLYSNNICLIIIVVFIILIFVIILDAVATYKEDLKFKKEFRIDMYTIMSIGMKNINKEFETLNKKLETEINRNRQQYVVAEIIQQAPEIT